MGLKQDSVQRKFAPKHLESYPDEQAEARRPGGPEARKHGSLLPSCRLWGIRPLGFVMGAGRIGHRDSPLSAAKRWAIRKEERSAGRQNSFPVLFDAHCEKAPQAYFSADGVFRLLRI